MRKRILPIVLIFVATCIAWFFLGGVTHVRTATQDSKLREAVSQLWGAPQKQSAPAVFYWQKSPEKQVEKIVDGQKIIETRADSIYHHLNLQKSEINVDLQLEHRKKGLLWYSTYRVSFLGKYTVKNLTDINRDILFTYLFPEKDGIYENFVLSVNGEKISDLLPESGRLNKWINLDPNEEAIIEIGYRSQGMDEWWYIFGEGVSQINDFTLKMTTDFNDINFPENSIAPSRKEKTEQGWLLTWQYGSLISGIQIGMDLPQKLNPGPFASRLSFFAPVSLFLFLFLMFIITTIKNIDIHPMNYFFICAAFFSFHLLMAYLIDHVNITAAFIVCSVVSIFLVISYMRLVVGSRFALIEVGLSQFVYLVVFSYAFFLEGYTGLSITILCIITLYAVMRTTAKIDWDKQFADSRKKVRGQTEAGIT